MRVEKQTRESSVAPHLCLPESGYCIRFYLGDNLWMVAGKLNLVRHGLPEQLNQPIGRHLFAIWLGEMGRVCVRMGQVGYATYAQRLSHGIHIRSPHPLNKSTYPRGCAQCRICLQTARRCAPWPSSRPPSCGTKPTPTSSQGGA